MRQFLEEKERRAREHHRARHRRAQADAERIIEMIIEQYRPERVIQWGSVLQPEHFRDYSDIDIAVEGITDPQQYFELLDKAEALTDFRLDIVQLEHVEPPYRKLLFEKGKVVYERRSAN
jgi:predicted nucleotidyltransferase